MSPREPYTRALVITPSDTVDIPNAPCDGIYAGSSGNITAVLDNGSVVLFTAVQIGTIVPVKVKRINSTASGSGPFVALWI